MLAVDGVGIGGTLLLAPPNDDSGVDDKTELAGGPGGPVVGSPVVGCEVVWLGALCPMG
jgi:hypothetical protein